MRRDTYPHGGDAMSVVYLPEHLSVTVYAYRGMRSVVVNTPPSTAVANLSLLSMPCVVRSSSSHDQWYLLYGDGTQRAIPFPTCDSAMMALQLLPEDFPHDTET